MTFPSILPKLWLFSPQVISNGKADVLDTCSQPTQHPLKSAGLRLLLLS